MIDPDGADLIFIVGAPGSKWSAIARAISFADQINVSDLSAERSYSGNSAPLHFGNYFGPGMQFGAEFEHLEDLSKGQLLEEFGRPYAAAGGVKLLKGHVFARHLNRLETDFPWARFVLVHRSDADCLTWWMEAGGFQISFPDYSWYRDIANMEQQIRLDNASISSFVKDRGLRLARQTGFGKLFKALELSYSAPVLTERARLAAPDEFDSLDPAAMQATLHGRAALARLAFCWPKRGSP